MPDLRNDIERVCPKGKIGSRATEQVQTIGIRCGLLCIIPPLLPYNTKEEIIRRNRGYESF